MPFFAVDIPDLVEAVRSLPIWLLTLIGAVLLFGAFQVYYWVGRKLGERLYASRVGERIGRDRILRIENIVRRWGALAVYGCFWVPVLRHTLPWVAGVLRVSYPWYVVASALGCATWVPVTVFGLYTVIWGWISIAAHSPVAAAALAVAVAAAAVLVVRRRRRRRASDDRPSKTLTPS
ncbi:DedA family protein [Thermostaphylospora chromogena]|uniref:Membrane protein DedA, SNARE-associated domain n=1 Tax=Thermostaphylospora chromogena TaxID=35622 RepID=A0A1H0ZY52_9ACTN|nr:VTT domain-containing protein [Thermostaphylospora chromogena]SDQ32333.1 membrane protein DedA, SNARE-associated domain [Thermostaphylospora chromogena]